MIPFCRHLDHQFVWSDAVKLSAPNVGSALMVMPRLVSVVFAPAASVSVMLPVLKVPATDGVPVKVTLPPVTVAVKPVGRLLLALTVNGPVPPLIGMAPGNPARFTVHCVAVSVPRVATGLMVMLR